VAVGVERQRDACVSEPLTHDFRVDTDLKEETRVSVAEIVHPKLLRKPRGRNKWLEVSIVNVCVEDGPSARCGEEQIGALGPRLLRRLMVAQDGEQFVRQRDTSAGTLGLGFLEEGALLGVMDATLNRDRLRRQVDITPPERPCLRSPQASKQEYRKEGGVAPSSWTVWGERLTSDRYRFSVPPPELNRGDIPQA
jgi:hypothetical protein